MKGRARAAIRSIRQKVGTTGVDHDFIEVEGPGCTQQRNRSRGSEAHQHQPTKSWHPFCRRHGHRFDGWPVAGTVRNPRRRDPGLDRAVADLFGANGLIIDVRGNSGDGFDSSTAFRNFELSPGTNAGSKRPNDKGTIALLIDERTISAGEGWASWFVARKRARVLGTTTAGASARKETYTLSNGLYKVVVSVKAYTGSLVRPIERQGLAPDVDVRCNAKDLAEGHDTVVDTAVKWLVNQSGR